MLPALVTLIYSPTTSTTLRRFFISSTSEDIIWIPNTRRGHRCPKYYVYKLYNNALYHNTGLGNYAVDIVNLFRHFRDIRCGRLDCYRNYSGTVLNAVPLYINTQPRQNQMAVFCQNFVYRSRIFLAIFHKNRDGGKMQFLRSRFFCFFHG